MTLPSGITTQVKQTPAATLGFPCSLILIILSTLSPHHPWSRCTLPLILCLVPAGCSRLLCRPLTLPLLQTGVLYLQADHASPADRSPCPCCIVSLLQTGVLFLHLEAEQHRLLASMVRAHEVGGLAGAAPRPPTFSRQAAPMQFDFYSRSCCLMYRWGREGEGGAGPLRGAVR